MVSFLTEYIICFRGIRHSPDGNKLLIYPNWSWGEYQPSIENALEGDKYYKLNDILGSGDYITIGRGLDNMVTLGVRVTQNQPGSSLPQEDETNPYVSKRHAKIWLETRGIGITDTSSNGLIVHPYLDQPTLTNRGNEVILFRYDHIQQMPGEKVAFIQLGLPRKNGATVNPATSGYQLAYYTIELYIKK